MKRGDYRLMCTALAMSVAHSGLDDSLGVLAFVSEFAHRMAEAYPNFNVERFLAMFWIVYAESDGVLSR